MRIIEIKSWTVPMYGSRHTVPYGLAIVEHNGAQKTVKLGRVDQNGVTYLTFNRRRYYYKNIRSLYNPKLTFYNPYTDCLATLRSYREVSGREMSQALNAWDNAQSLSELTNQELYIAYIKIKFTETYVKIECLANSKRRNRQRLNWVRLVERGRIPTDAKYYNPRITYDGLHW